MPQLQTRNQDLEKRLAHLRAQLYGKNKQSSSLSKEAFSSSKQPSVISPTDNSVVYLRHDLLKIFILAGLAFIFQFTLYFALLKNIIKLS